METPQRYTQAKGTRFHTALLPGFSAQQSVSLALLPRPPQRFVSPLLSCVAASRPRVRSRRAALLPCCVTYGGLAALRLAGSPLCYTVGVSDSKRPEGPLSAVSRLSGLSRDEVYRRFRLEGAPAPVDHVACVPVYDLEAAVAWLLPPDRGQPTSIDLAPVRPSGLAASQPPV
jgi:hypothetical protein